MLIIIILIINDNDYYLQDVLDLYEIKFTPEIQSKN